jgi:hypothetical protein
MKKIRPFWRVLIALLADVIFVLSLGYQASRTNSYYFRIMASALTPGNILAGFVVLYLSIVAISGRWWPFNVARSGIGPMQPNNSFHSSRRRFAGGLIHAVVGLGQAA